MNCSNLKQQRLNKLCGNGKNTSTEDRKIFRALAIDQRGALKKMLGESSTKQQIEEFKILVSKELTPYASAILLDPEFGWKAAELKDIHCGLIMAYEKTGYDKTKIGRFPDLIEGVSVKQLKEKGADAIKFLLYIDIDEDHEINRIKTAFVERIGSECLAEDMPFFLEILTYDCHISDKKAFAKVKPRKVIEAMKLFSEPRFNVDVLKVEIPVDMDYVEGFAQEDILYSQATAKAFYQEQNKCTPLPFIFLSAGVKPELFQQTLLFAKQAGSRFNGVLCGRATWGGGTDIFKAQGGEQAALWLQTQGIKHISELNHILTQTATPLA